MILPKWERFWFTPQTPDNLDISRILFYGLFFLYFWNVETATWADVSPVFWQPLPLFRYLGLSVLPHQCLQVLSVIWKTSLLLCCIGLFTRLNTWVAFLLGVYLVGLPHNFGKIHHNDALFVLVLGVMAVSRCGQSWSLDALIQKPTNNPSGEYQWPIRTVWLLLSLIFFAAGVAKVRNGGLAWVFSDALAIHFNHNQYHTGGDDPMVNWGGYLAQYPPLRMFLAVSTILIEFFYPLTLFSRRARTILVPAMFLMQVGIRVALGPSFLPFLICNVFWVPWDRVLLAKKASEHHPARGRFNSHSPATVAERLARRRPLRSQ